MALLSSIGKVISAHYFAPNIFQFPKKYGLVSLALGLFFAINLSLNAQNLPTPTFGVGTFDFCEGDSLSFDLNGLPDPLVEGDGMDTLNVRINWKLASVCGEEYINGFVDVVTTSTSHSFTTNYILTNAIDHNAVFKIALSHSDWGDYENDLTPIDSQLTCVPVTVSLVPDGAISITDPSVTTICAGDTFQVDFTATVGTGPYDLVINGNQFNGITSPSTLTLTEGIDFIGDAAAIDLDSITDTGVAGNCVKTGSPINSLTGPIVNDFTLGSLSNSDTTICSGEQPEMLTGPAATGDGDINYGWQISTNNGGIWIDISGATDVGYLPPAFNSDALYRRVDSSSLNGIVCYDTTNSVSVIINNYTIGSLSNADMTICEGEQPAYLTGPTAYGDGTINYGWQMSINDGSMWTDVAGEMDEGFQPPTLSADTWYRRVDTSTLNGTLCWDTTNIVKVFVNNFAVGSLSTADTTICSGEQPVMLTGPAPTADGTISYGWQESTNDGGLWTDVSGAVSVGYQPPALTADAWYRRVDSSNLNNIICYDTTDIVKIFVNNFSVGSLSNADTTICEGMPPALLTGPAGVGDGTFSYGWQESTNDGGLWTEIIGVTNIAYQPPVLSADAWYRRIDTSSLNGVKCWANTNIVKVYVNNFTVGSLTNADTTICEGEQPAILTGPTATGDGTITYGWKVSTDDGVQWTAVTGAINQGYQPPVLSADAWYRRVDTSNLNGALCWDSTSIVKIYVNNFTVGSLSNADTTLCEGEQPALLTGPVASGDGTISHGWETSTNYGGLWTIVNGATNVDYQPPALTADAWYRRIDTSSLNGVLCWGITNHVQIWVNNFSVGSLTNADTTLCEGAQPEMITGLAPTADGTISYGWQVSTNDGGMWMDVSGAINQGYQPSALTADAWYRRVDSSNLNNIICYDTTNIVKVYINNFTVGSLANADTTICEGEQPAMLTGPAAVGDGDLKYGWQRTTNDGVTWADVVGATSISYLPPPLILDAWYRRVDTSSLNGVVCWDTTNMVKVYINNFTVGSLSNADTTICEGEQPLMLTGPNGVGEGTMSQGWQMSINDGGLWTDIMGATDVGYLPPAMSVDTWYRRVDTSNLYGTLCWDTTNIVKVSVNNFAAGSLSNGDLEVCFGDEPATLTGPPATGDGIFNYGWQSSTNDGGMWTDIAGETNEDYVPPTVTTDIWYRRIDTASLNNVLCWDIADTIKITLIEKPIPTITGSTAEICVGEQISLPYTVTGGSLIYTDTTWLNSDPSVISISPEGLITGLASGFSEVKILVTDANGCQDSSAAHTVVVNSLPVAGDITGPNQVCMGSTISLTSNESGVNGGLIVVWDNPNPAIAIVDTATGEITPVNPGTINMSYSVSDNKGCSAVSNLFLVTVKALPTPTLVSNDTTICQGDLVKFTAGGGTDYEFLLNNMSQGAASATDTFLSSSLNHDDIIKVIVTDAVGCFDTSTAIQMIVDTIPDATLTSDVVNTIGTGQAVVFTGTGGISYEFFINNISQQGPSAFDTFATNTINHLDTIMVEVTDGNTCGDTATLVMMVNAPPVANNDTIIIFEDALPDTIDVQFNDTDPEGDILTTMIATPAVHGISSVANNDSLIYTPDSDYNGLDSIEYQVCDLYNNCAIAKLIITVLPVNDAPVANEDTLRILEDAPVNIVDVQANDYDIDGDTLITSIFTFPNKGTATVNMDSTISYQPMMDSTGLDGIIYQVCDPDGSCVFSIVVIEITPVNDAPIAVRDSFSVPEDTTNVHFAIIVNDIDIDDDTLTLDSLYAPTSGGTATILDDTMMVYTPPADFFGTDTILYRVCDTSIVCDMDTVIVTVVPKNDKPLAIDDFVTVNEDTTNVFIDVQANDSDADGDILTTIVISSTMIVDTLNGDSIIATPPADFTGIQLIGYKICDPTGLCDTGIVTVTVLPVNDAPIANPDYISVNQDTTMVGISPLINDTDVDDVTLTITSVTSSVFGTATFVSPDSVYYTPNFGFFGIDSIAYTVCDTSNLCDMGLIFVSVGFVNNAPMAVNDTVPAINEDASATMVNVVLNDSDLEGSGDTLKVNHIIDFPDNGTAMIIGDSTISYTPFMDFNGQDSLLYTVCDTSAFCSTAWVFFTVNAVNDAPVAVNDTVGYLTRDTTNVLLEVIANDYDVEGSPLTVNTIGNSTEGVMLSVINDSILYSTPIGFVGIDTVTYEISDGSLKDTALLIIVISDPNNIPPTANTDFANSTPSSSIYIDVQANDVEPNGDPLKTYILSGPSALNMASVQDLDSILYTPSANFAGYDTIIYQVCDPSLTCDSDTVFITVTNTLIVKVKAILEGPFNASTDRMHDSLRALNLIPSVEPYSTLPSLSDPGTFKFTHKNGGGNETIADPMTVFGTIGDDAIVDWVYLELLTEGDTIPIASRSALIQRDGDVVEVDGTSEVGFDFLPDGNYFLSIRHRNHLGVMTKTALPYASGAFNQIDFSHFGVGATEAYGTNAMDTVQTRLVLWAGDGNADRKIIYDGISNDRDPVFYDVFADPLNVNSNYNHVSYGYHRGDYDMKGSSIYIGGKNDPDVVFFNTFLHPNNTLGSTIFIIWEQIPRK